jgi:hypothetical protein
MIKPPCFDTQADFEAYMELLDQTVKDENRSFCWDCTPEYQRSMVKQNLCTHKETVFVVNAEGIFGRRKA